MAETEDKHLFILLWLIAIHSFFVGVALLVLPASIMEFFGYTGYSGRFFQMQGGVFHMIMAVIYVIAARDLNRSLNLVIATIWIKAAATVFLLSYFLFFENIIVILMSGLADGGMGLAVYILYRRHKAARVS